MTDQPIHPLLGEAGVAVDARFEQHATDISNLAERVSALEDRLDDIDQARVRREQAIVQGHLTPHPALRTMAAPHTHGGHPFGEQQANDRSREIADRREASYRSAEGL